MRQILRFYGRHDIDLIALKINGVSLGKLAKEALVAYANGKDIIVRIPYIPEDKLNAGDNLIDQIMNKKKSGSSNTKEFTGYRCEIRVNDPNAIKVLQSVKSTYRNQFLKTLIRNSLNRQSLLQYFKENSSAMEIEKGFMKEINDRNYRSEIKTPMQNTKADMKDILKSPEERKEETKDKKQNIVVSEEKEKINMPVQEKVISEISEIKPVKQEVVQEPANEPVKEPVKEPEKPEPEITEIEDPEEFEETMEVPTEEIISAPQPLMQQTEESDEVLDDEPADDQAMLAGAFGSLMGNY